MTICAIAGGMTLVGVTSGFTKAPNSQGTAQWVLKSGASVGSTVPSDYEQGAPDCPGQIHFCAFDAPADPITPSEPDIDAVTNLENDLNNLAANANGHYNSSGAVHYEDAAQ